MTTRADIPVTIAVVQAALGGAREANVACIESLVREAAARGAALIVVPELFETRYFPGQEREEHFELAHPLAGHPAVEHFRRLAAELAVVIPVSFFERDGDFFYNIGWQLNYW